LLLRSGSSELDLMRQPDRARFVDMADRVETSA
jgi:hypothetical protein